MRISDLSSDVCSSDLPVPQRRLYVPVRIKFCLSLLIALTWTGLSVWLSLPWVDDLGRLLGRPLALALITFIAYVPGFMNAFLISTILLDRRPRSEERRVGKECVGQLRCTWTA